MKVAVAMSGGVDSSVAAALLKEQDYEVIGVTMQVRLPDNGPDAAVNAKAVADMLGIPHYVADFREIFTRKVITHFCGEYSLGRTPNPCVRCNQFIKFGALLTEAKELGADFMATGHYARVEKEDAGGRRLLKKGSDCRKDQSYFLHALNQEQLRHSLFPLGELTKAKVRRMAEELDLPVANRPESQEICFIPDNDYPAFLKDYVGDEVKPGPVLDGRGNTLGEHRGIIFYTIGQRRGLGISAGEPLYVVAINREENAIIVGSKEEAYAVEFTASELNWIALDEPKRPMRVNAKIRYRHQEAEALVTPSGENRVRVEFKEPQMAIAPGQAVVFYDGDTVIGGGSIEQVKGKGGL